MQEIIENTCFVCDTGLEDTPYTEELAKKYTCDRDKALYTLKYSENGLSLISDNKVLRGDFSKLTNRVKGNNINSEMLIKAARIKDKNDDLVAIDATAGLGDDSFLLAAAGFEVHMYEKNPLIFELLNDALHRAFDIPSIVNIASRMHIYNKDSIIAMNEENIDVDVVLLDPMFPERKKSGLVKNKLQVIKTLEEPCRDEKELLLAAANAGPKKLIIKRPLKGEYLGDLKPDHSISGKAVRYDCIVEPKEKSKKWFL